MTELSNEPNTPNDVRPFHFTQRQPFAETTQRRHHREPLYAFGEYAMFVCLWKSSDFDKGLVGRCPVCFGAAGRAARAYGQGDKTRCPECYGTTFEGGYRAKIIRPALFTDRVVDTIEQSVRGDQTTDQVSVETTSDFTLRHGDWVVRQGNLRYQAEEKGIVVIRSGFGQPQDANSQAGMVSSARLEDSSSPAYLVPPTDADTLDSLLIKPVGQHIPDDLSALDDVRGDLVL